MNYGAWGEVGIRNPGSSQRATDPLKSHTASLFEDADSFASVAPLPSNVEAIEAALQFVAGGIRQTAIVGPTGSGKSHLLRAVTSVAERTLGATVDVLSTEVFLSARRGMENQEVILLDDVQVALGRPRMRQDLRRILESRVRRSKATLMAFTIDPGPMGTLGMRAIQGLLPSPRAWTIAPMNAPTREERPSLLGHLARAEGLRLSSALSTVLARELGGNGHTLTGAMRRLRLDGGDWSTARRTLRALGVLDPFFSDNSSWDLRHEILHHAEHQRVHFAQFVPVELALYTMLHEARLCERSVAEYLDKSPAEAYGLAARFGRALQDNPSGRALVDEFVDGVVARLVR